MRGDLDWITMKAIAKEPDLRYESASRFRDDIQHYLNGDLVEARPPSFWYTLTKSVKRNRLAVASGLAVVTALLFAIGSHWWGYGQSQENLAEARTAHCDFRSTEFCLAEMKRARSKHLHLKQFAKCLILIPVN